MTTIRTSIRPKRNGRLIVNHNVIIGCGGVGTWLLPSLKLLVPGEKIVLVDGDTIEKKNLDRQLFDQTAIGKNKADALAARFECESLPTWFHCGTMALDREDMLLVCVDNHKARAEALTACDLGGATAIVAANETQSSEAYVYRPEWRDHPKLDPRIYYPEILTDKSGDPMAARIGCVGEAQKYTPQLVTANQMAAALAMHLYVVWAQEVKTLDSKFVGYCPHKLSCTIKGITTTSVNDSMAAAGQK